MYGSDPTRFQSPSLRGSGRFQLDVIATFRSALVFQSPSLRGSGRFRYAASRMPHISTRFQSPSLRGSGRFQRRSRWRRRRERVSIPFIAGQWSLLAGGASTRRRCRVSIPFIAGQWSLQVRTTGSGRPRTFQSPSLRGSGRFTRSKSPGIWTRCMFQSPSLRGSGRFKSGPRGTARRGAGFNPLHCGAVVASHDHHQTGSRLGRSFNPLHCGAVVASWKVRVSPSKTNKFQSPSLRGSGRFLDAAILAALDLYRVSIPFIAGQWSLPTTLATAAVLAVLFQSPSLRGSGRFSLQGIRLSLAWGCFNPLHCGAVVASNGAPQIGARLSGRFQSPSLRGSGRFGGMRVTSPHAGGMFQSPSLRGSGRFRPAPRSPRPGATCFNPLHCGAVVASRRGRRRRGARATRFNPLHCGAVVASLLKRLRHVLEQDVSIPFIAGQWSLLDGVADRLTADAEFQSPSLRGSGRFGKPPRRWCAAATSFNPLHCGAVVASRKGGNV